MWHAIYYSMLKVLSTFHTCEAGHTITLVGVQTVDTRGPVQTLVTGAIIDVGLTVLPWKPRNSCQYSSFGLLVLYKAVGSKIWDIGLDYRTHKYVWKMLQLHVIPMQLYLCVVSGWHSAIRNNLLTIYIWFVVICLCSIYYTICKS